MNVIFLQGGTISTDVIGVEWHKTGAVHYGLTVAYYGFMSDGKHHMVKLFYFLKFC